MGLDLALDRELRKALMDGNRWQIILIASGAVASILLGVFFYREMFPEYRHYQMVYENLEAFRSTYTGDPAPSFKQEVKQLVFEREDRGPARIDRCTSCHVALEFSHFSPTKLEYDLNGDLVRDARGRPVQIPNEEYVWTRLDAEIAKLLDPALNQQLRAQGLEGKADFNALRAQELEAWKTTHEEEHVFDNTVVLRAHPLMGMETRPFEYHPVEEYGCTSCHNGNGRSVVTERAHGPVFDGAYKAEFTGFVPEFIEKDPLHDPHFAAAYNAKPSEEMIFQTTPLFVGGLVEAKCVQCHQTTATTIDSRPLLQKSLENEKQRVESLWSLQQALQEKGYEETLAVWKSKAEDYTLSPLLREQTGSQLRFLTKWGAQGTLPEIQRQLEAAFGTAELVKTYQPPLDSYLKSHPDGWGTLYQKITALEKGNSSQMEALLAHYHEGEALYQSQACYACHKIAGLARGGIGPELTNEGDSPPWFIKESIVWPQADLKTSTMPNFRMDHDEVESLMTFLLGQKGANSSVSRFAYKANIQAWEAGKKLPWENPLDLSKRQDVTYGMKVFATEGCAACHRLKGYASNVGYALEKQNPSAEALYAEGEWFRRQFPEMALGQQLGDTVDKRGDELDRRLVADVRSGALLETLEKEHPGLIASFYQPFKFAARLHPHDPKYQKRLHHVLMMYVQEYGLGRLIAPRPNWSGVMRSDEWLMEHFRNPQSKVPRSIMPIFPFDDSKFYLLTHMLNEVSKQNRDAMQAVWKTRGFSPSLAYQTLCAQCHGEFLQGNGPVAPWIYPIPKNLNNPDFLRNLTRERIEYSLRHGVKGTPMPPWGEVGNDKTMAMGGPILNAREIDQLTDWLFSSLPGAQVIQKSEDVRKWQYGPEDVLEELKKEGAPLSRLETPSSYLAALTTTPVSENEIEKIFDVIPNPLAESDAHLYYIKKTLYTPENLAQGQEFFLINCAACHGKEADGLGLRAEAMQDAKPRMLTNLTWAESRDDLRLLRSIKFGVPGTSMTPWGDLTTSWKRLQLVMYIRSLSQSNELRQKLLSALYQTYDAPLLNLDNGLQKDVLVKEERLFSNLGFALLLQPDADVLIITVLSTLSNRRTGQDPAILKDQETLLALLNQRIQTLKTEKKVEEGRITSSQKSERIRMVETKLAQLIKLRNQVIATYAEAARLRKQQQDKAQ